MEAGDLWQELGSAWESYRGTVEAWMQISPDADADPRLVDGLTHQVISGHNEWSERLAAVLEATHKH